MMMTVMIQGLSGDGDLVLPTLMHPAPPNTPPVDEWFTVQNTSGRALDIEIQGQLNMAMADLIALLVLSRESNLPLKKFTLAAGDSLEIKVRVEARKDARIPSNFGKKYKDFPLGKLHLRSEHVAETILVHGSLEPVRATTRPSRSSSAHPVFWFARVCRDPPFRCPPPGSTSGPMRARPPATAPPRPR